MDSHMLQQSFITYGRITLWVGDFAWQKWETIRLISRPSEWDFKDGPEFRVHLVVLHVLSVSIVKVVAYRVVGTADQVASGEKSRK